jgi:hypothetical protein
MDEPLIIKALQDKRAEIHGRITAYEAQIAQAKWRMPGRSLSVGVETNEVRPHGAIGNKPPAALLECIGATSPSMAKEAGKSTLR